MTEMKKEIDDLHNLVKKQDEYIQKLEIDKGKNRRIEVRIKAPRDIMKEITDLITNGIKSTRFEIKWRQSWRKTTDGRVSTRIRLEEVKQ